MQCRSSACASKGTLNLSLLHTAIAESTQVQARLLILSISSWPRLPQKSALRLLIWLVCSQVRQMFGAVMGRLPALAYLPGPAAAPTAGAGLDIDDILAPSGRDVDVSGLPSPSAAAPVAKPSVPLPAPGAQQPCR